MKKITPNDMTPEECRAWLMEHDPEARHFWSTQPLKNMREAVNCNLKDFGDHLEGDVLLRYTKHLSQP